MKKILLINLFAAILIFLGGCGTSRPSRFYTLNSMPIPPEKAELSDKQNRITVGIDLNDIPAYLNKPQMTVRVSANELKLDEFNRWAETVKDSFPKIIADNFISILPTDKFIVFSRKGIISVDYQIIINVTRFDGAPGKSVSLITQWGIYDSKEDKLLSAHTSDINVKVNGDDFDSLVTAQSKAMELLSRQMSPIVEGLVKK
ncbi:membrane integrity-associated transporter subunit PqiC [bacterium]|nr:membrane integrity-associated transporter subunit PqiC [bacterium]